MSAHRATAGQSHVGGILPTGGIYGVRRSHHVAWTGASHRGGRYTAYWRGLQDIYIYLLCYVILYIMSVHRVEALGAGRSTGIG